MAHSAWIGDVARAKSTALAERDAIPKRFWDITISCFLSPHVSVFRKSREKEKGGCRNV